jgi:hypothetical protein
VRMVLMFSVRVDETMMEAFAENIKKKVAV